MEFILSQSYYFLCVAVIKLPSDQTSLLLSLLVMGMDHYGSSSWKLIQENLLPTKTPHQVCEACLLRRILLVYSNHWLEERKCTRLVNILAMVLKLYDALCKPGVVAVPSEYASHAWIARF